MSCGALQNVMIKVLALFALATSAAAQDVVGTDICACQPGEYRITLNFGLECDDRDVDGNVVAGVQETACVVERVVDVDPPAELADPFPVSVSEILFTELDQALQIVKLETITDTFVNGAELVYTSITSGSPDEVNSNSLPVGLQVALTGVNAAGVELQNTYVIIYNQNCSVYPVITDGMQIGWTIFTSVAPPPAAVCPLALEGGESTLNTTSSDFPSNVPSSVPSALQSESSDVPSLVPSGVPMLLESDFPSLGPSVTPSIFLLESDLPSLSPTTGLVPSTMVPETPVPTPNIPETVSPAPMLLETTMPSTAEPTTMPPVETPVDAPTEPTADVDDECEDDEGKGKGKKGKKGKGKGKYGEEDEDDETDDDSGKGGKGKGKGKGKKKKCKKKKGKGGGDEDNGKGKRDKKEKKDDREPKEDNSGKRKGTRRKKSKNDEPDESKYKKLNKDEESNSDKRAKKHVKDGEDRRLRRMMASV